MAGMGRVGMPFGPVGPWPGDEDYCHQAVVEVVEAVGFGMFLNPWVAAAGDLLREGVGFGMFLILLVVGAGDLLQEGVGLGMFLIPWVAAAGDLREEDQMACSLLRLVLRDQKREGNFENMGLKECRRGRNGRGN